ncbi:hypothetical protein ACJW31_12G094800 [Castanea mollissima]
MTISLLFLYSSWRLVSATRHTTMSLLALEDDFQSTTKIAQGDARWRHQEILLEREREREGINQMYKMASPSHRISDLPDHNKPT